MRKWNLIIGSCLLTASVFGASVLQAEAAPMRVQVVDGDVRAVLLSAARLGGVDLVLADDVKGTVTVDLNEEPHRVIDLVAASKGLVVEREGNTYLVAAGTNGAGLRRVHVYPVRYADPVELASAADLALSGPQMLRQTSDTASGKVKEGQEKKAPQRVLVDTATNSLLLYGTSGEAAAVSSLVRELDVPVKQVALEAKVVALTKDASRDLGVTWQWSPLPQYPNVKKTRYYRRNSDEIDEEIERTYNNGNTPGVIRFGRGPEGRPYEFYYGARIDALVTNGKAKMLARPNITTVQGKEAVINIGGEVPVPTISTTDSTTTTSIEYRQAGIILRYTPRVHPDGQITAVVHTEVSSPTYVEGLGAYRFQKRSADTTVRLRDGETMVIGGLIGQEEARSFSKVPFLGDLPILGQFFRHSKNSKSDSELMIFLTAHVLPDPQDAPK